MSKPAFHRIASLLLGFLAAGAAAPAQCALTAEPVAEQAPAQAHEASEAGEVAESARSTVRSMTVWLARGVDSWFGDRPFEDGGKVSDGRLSAALLFRQHDRPDFDVRFNARFRLPNIEERIYGFIGRDDQRDVVTDKPGAFSRQDRLLEEARDREFFAGIGRSLTDSVDLRLGLRGGLKPFAQARYRRQWLLGPNDLADFRQTVFWSLDDHFGSTTALSYEHAFTPELAARWLNSATITQESKYFEWSSLVGAYRSFGEQRVAALEALVSGEQGPGVEPSDYGVQVRWEQPVHEDWLLGGVVVGHFWPRENALVERRSAWAVGVSLKMRF
ncbi:hypothetical protein [Ideonella sp.]|uniref:hypothetical protein n=1 Tax=Ideonella sp. TaxID=1929293 RepID=UPI002B45EB19|nr:hypothetical protein [Ideonella sp.]HJV69975.1 hypothetical protein [Ideonella sp.]